MAQGIASNPEAEALRKLRIGLAQKGKPKSPEAVAKMKAALPNRYGKNNANYKGVRKNKICENCGKTFLSGYDKRAAYRFCTLDCKFRFVVGEKHPRYKSGDYSHGNRNYKYGYAHIKWRKAVLERDKYTCVLCGSRYRELHVDHIKPFKDFKDLRYKVSNGRTLCKRCHYEITFRKSPLDNWKAYSNWAKVTRGKPAKAVAAAETNRGDKLRQA